MASLSKAEQDFLTDRQEEAARLRIAVAKAESQISPIEKQIDEIQPQIDELMSLQNKLRDEKTGLIEAHNLVAVKKQLATVSRDVTKLLRKQRDA